MSTGGADHSDLMGTQPIIRLLIRFSVPAVIGMMVQALYNIVDRIYIGRAVGSVGIAATTVSFPLMMIGFAFGLMIGIGASALVSIKLGEQQKDQAEEIMGNAVVLLVITSLLFMAGAMIFMEPLLRVFGSTPTIMPYSKAYMQIIVLGWLVQTTGFGMNSFIRSEGNPKIAMVTMLIGSVTNFILDPIFIFGFGWGIQGAAAATVIAQCFSAFWVLRYFFSGKSILKIRARYFRLKPVIVGKILALGSAPFFMHITDSMMMALVNTQIRIHGGDMGLSMMGVIMSLMMMIFMFVMGVSQGTQPIIGYNYGAGQFGRVKETLKLGIYVVTVGVSVGWILIMSFPGQIVRIFINNDEAMVELGIHALRIFFLLVPLLGFQALSSGFFQAVGKAKQSIFLALSRTVLLAVPGIILLPYFFGLDGVWMSTPISIAGSSIITGTFLWMTMRELGEPKLIYVSGFEWELK